MRLLKLQIFRNKATNCQGASRVSNTALAHRARPIVQKIFFEIFDCSSFPRDFSTKKGSQAPYGIGTMSF